ncbi:hypothetical protein K1719_016092 [Acacia pycnantha]|nr:hypothetical protein K1719_016092 [Acacia pycnantha]
MAQFPPKIPNMAPNGPDFSSHQKTPSFASFSPNNAAADHQNPSWVDEFLDFSSIRQGAHCQSMSDSIAFIEAPLLDDCHDNPGVIPPRSRDDIEFDRFDDDQLISMFIDNLFGLHQSLQILI